MRSRDHVHASDERTVRAHSYARETKNYSGAELEGVVKSACSYALDEKVNLESVSSGKGISAEVCACVCVR